ncbi:MAG TPA: HAD family hydrolase [Solirubrobacteraceae bacterium]|nr:HAD family hydrolase [Solirubrobacteraceae bacterium]
MIAILDIDGTLVDTNYHHTIAWYRALRYHDLILPNWRIHRHIGMGGDKMVQALTDEQTEREHGDTIRAAEGVLYAQLIAEVETMAGSRELIAELKRRGHKVVFASSAKAGEVDHYLDLLDARGLADAWTTSDDVEATKPSPDLVHAALSAVGASADDADAILIGDTPWDVEAASGAGIGTLAVLTGGFGRDELTAAGAVAVFESVDELRRALGDTPLG